MKPKNPHSHPAKYLQNLVVVFGGVFATAILVGTVQAASSWAPTLLVNTEAFQVIDDTDSSANIVLKFGGSLAKTLTYDRSAGQFTFDDDLEVIGSISGATIHAQDSLSTSGSLVFEGIASGSSLYLGNKLEGAGLSDCDDATNSKLLWDTTTGRFSCGTDQSGSGGGGSTGTGSLQLFFDNRYVRTSGDTMTGALLIHSTNDATVTADTGLLLEIAGTASGDILHAQNTISSSGGLVIQGTSTLSGSVTIKNVTEGSVLFSGANGLVSQDNTNLYWNDVNNTLMLPNLAGTDATATSTRGADLSVSGGRGTGTASGGDIFFKTAPATAAESPIAASFTSASTQYLYKADNADLSFANEDFSITGWVYFNSIPSSGQFAGIVSKYNNSANDREYALYLEGTTGKLRFVVTNNGSTAAGILDSTVAISTGTWYFVYAEHDSVNNLLRMKVNTNAFGSTSYTSGGRDGTSNFTLGSINTLANSYLNGRLDSIGLYNRTLSDTELTYLYNSGNGKTYGSIGIASTDGSALKTSLVSWWDLDELSDTRSDSNGTNDLTSVNSVSSTTGLTSASSTDLNTLNTRMVITSSGSVGIGSVNPMARLTVSGSTLLGKVAANALADSELEVIGTASGINLHAQEGLTSSGTLVFEGIASGSSLYLGNKLEGAGLSDCDDATNSKLLWDTTTGRFSCGTDQSGSGGGGSTGTGSLQLFFDNRYVRTSGDTMTGALLIHSTNDATVTADTGLLLEVSGTSSGTVIHAQRQLTSSGSTTIGIYNTSETGLFIDQNTNARGIDIDTEATTQNALEISAGTLTTGKAINVGDGDAFTTGTGLLATFVSNSSNTGKRSLFHLANEHTSADSTLVMNLKQNGDTTNLYMDQNGNGISIDVDSQATTQPGIRISMPSQDASANPHLLFGYENVFDTNLFRNAYNALTTSGSLSVDPPGFNGVYRYDGASYNSNVAEARTTGGTAFALLSAENPSNDYLYVGANSPFGVIHIDLATASAGISTLGADYYNGSTWVALGVTDNTTHLTVDGTLEINPPNNWTAVNIDADLTAYYWLRIHANSANITTAPTAYSVSPTQGYRFRVWSQADDAQPALFVSHDQKVGIKTSAPKTALEVVGTMSGSTLVVSSGAIIQSGRVGIGTTTPEYTLEVAGDVNTTAGGYRDAGSCVAGTCASDERLKHNIKPIENALDTVSKLSPSSYEFNDPHFGSGKQFGLIAQEVEKVLPGLVEDNVNGYKTVKYGMQLQMLTMAAVKELNAKVEEMGTLHFGKELEEKVAEYAKQMQEISERLSKLEEQTVDASKNGMRLQIQDGGVTVSGAYHLIQAEEREGVLALLREGKIGQILVLQASPESVITVRKTQKLLLTKNDCKLEGEDVLVLMKVDGEHWIELSRSANSRASLHEVFNGWSGMFQITQ